jgi:hypothetical protein
MKKLIAFISGVLLLALVMGCKQDPDPDPEPTPVTVTKNVTVTFPAFSPGTSMSFAPTYAPEGGWGEHFSASDITYTVICAELSKTYNSGNGWTANFSDGYANNTTPVFTQTFKMGTATVGSQVIQIDVAFGTFGAIRDAGGTTLSPQAIPSVTLRLEKTK